MQPCTVGSYICTLCTVVTGQLGGVITMYSGHWAARHSRQTCTVGTEGTGQPGTMSSYVKVGTAQPGTMSSYVKVGTAQPGTMSSYVQWSLGSQAQ
jgi:hypothetical protein